MEPHRGQFTSKTAKAAGAKSSRGASKLTTEVKDRLGQIIANKIEELEEDLKAMSKKDQWDLIAKLSEYAFPKLARIQTELEMPNNTIIFENVSKTMRHGE